MRDDVSIAEIAGEPRGWRYHSGPSLWTERFIDGRLLCAAMQDNGVPVFTRDEHRDQPAFELVVDGESLASGWTLAAGSMRPGSTAWSRSRALPSRKPAAGR